MKTLKDRIILTKGDITKIEVDVIVNAANSTLLGGGGVDGAIHRAGGPEILEACKQIVAQQGPCKTGHAVITTSGKLPARFVVHTVGPIWKGGHKNEAQKLADAYHNSLQLAADNNCKTIAFPNISTGVYRFPKDKAACISVEAIVDFLATNPLPERVFLVCYDNENYIQLQTALR